MSTFHATRLVVPKWKMPSLNTFLDSLTKEQDKLIQVGVIKYSKGKDHTLMVQGRKNARCWISTLFDLGLVPPLSTKKTNILA